jgi:kinesin family member 18/19
MKTQENITNENKTTVNNILVAVRVRPLSETESKNEGAKIVEALDGNVLILMDPTEDRFNVSRLRSKEKHYGFDVVLNESSSQQEVFTKTTEFLLEGLINGYNASVFAYGPTGAGKTYTMVGEADSPGVMLNTFQNLFSRLESLSRDIQYKVRLSYLEIYNENIRDLLKPNREGLDIREDPQRGIVVAGLSEILGSSIDIVFSNIKYGNKRRICEPTKANQTSSRSHAILQIIVEHRDRALGTQSEIMIGKLSLIDLAGSERAAKTKNKGLRMIEGANINKSLLSLGNCINALCELNEKGGKIFIPYRDSKLTRLLKDSLGGNCRTVMIACISPSKHDYEDTYNTLIYANRAKNIKTSVYRNSLNVQYHISRYTSIINQLKQEILDLRNQLGSKIPVNSKFESFLIQITNHFQEEARLRKNIYLNQQKTDNIGFSLFSKQSELIETSLEKGKSSQGYEKLKEDVETLKKNAEKLEKQVQEFRNRLEMFEKKRQDFENEWIEAGITEPYISHLALEVKKHSLLMNSLDFEGKEAHNKLVIEQKDMYIKLLEEQLILRDSIIKSKLPKLESKKLKHIKSFDQINSHFTSHSPIKKMSIALPDIQKSKIPKPKLVEDSPKIYKKELSPIKREDNKSSELKYSNKYKLRNRAMSVESKNSENSAGSTYSDNKIKYSNISEKYLSSPYVKSSLKKIRINY